MTIERNIFIRPLIGITYNGNDINFGMNQNEIANLWGTPPKFSVNNTSKKIEEPREGRLLTYEFEGDYFSRTEKLKTIEIIIDKGWTVFYENIDIFNDLEVIKKLTEYDTPTPNNGKYINFYKLGISLGGFGKKKIEENKMIFIFSEDKIKFFEMLFKIGGGKM
jgi:hypothetical protein